MNRTLSTSKALFILGTIIGLLPLLWYAVATIGAALLGCKIRGDSFGYSGSFDSCSVLGFSLGSFFHTAESSSILVLITVPIGLILWVTSAISFGINRGKR